MRTNIIYTVPISIFLLTASYSSASAAALKDCSQVKKLHKKLACQLGAGNNEKEIDSKLNKLLKPTLADYFKRKK